MEKMHLIITDQTYMHDLAYAKRVNEVAAHLGLEAQNTFLVFGYRNGSQNDSFEQCSIIDLRVSSAFKVFSYFVSIIKVVAWLRANGERYDRLIFENLLSAWFVIFLKQSSKRRSHFDLHGDVPSELMSLRGSYFWSLIAKVLQKVCINSFSSFSVCSSNHRDILVLYLGVDYKKISVIKNAATFIEAERPNFTKSDRIRHGVYLGSAATWQNPLEIISFAQCWLNVDSRNSFKIITQDVEKFTALIELKHKDLFLDQRLSIFSAFGSELKGTLEGCDFGLIIRKRDLLNFVSSPTKIFDYQRAGIKILYSGYIGDLSRSSDDDLICMDDLSIEDLHSRYGHED